MAPASVRLVNWRLKARVQNVIAALPFGSGKVYYLVQRTVGGLRKGLNHPMERFRAAIRIAHRIEAHGLSVRGKRFIEVGTGHMVNVPTGLWLMGAEQTITVDLNRYLSAALVKESMDYIRANIDKVHELFGPRASDPEFKARLNRLATFAGPMKELLEMMSVRYMSPADAASLPLDSHSMDFHISNTVLEHIPRDGLVRILREGARAIKSEGLLVHIIDLSDHFSHADSSISPVNFLRFNDQEWDRLAGNRFMYQNRLRARDYEQIFKESGVEILEIEPVIDGDALADIAQPSHLDERFRDRAPEELATVELCVVAKPID